MTPLRLSTDSTKNSTNTEKSSVKLGWNSFLTAVILDNHLKTVMHFFFLTDFCSLFQFCCSFFSSLNLTQLIVSSTFKIYKKHAGGGELWLARDSMKQLWKENTESGTAFPAQTRTLTMFHPP